MDPFNLTDAERNAPGGQSTMQGGVQSAYNPPLPAPAPAPAQSVVTGEPVAEPQPTQGDTLNTIKTEALRIQDILNSGNVTESNQAFSAPGAEQFTDAEEFDVDAAQREAQRAQLKLHQAEIDATNQVYDQLLNEARVQGQGRLGSQRAIAWRRGMAGSPAGSAQKEKVQSPTSVCWW